MEIGLRDRVTGNGFLLQLLAFGHAAVGFAYYRAELRSIVSDRVVAAVPYRGPKSTAFWFLMPAAPLWMAGHMVSAAEEAHDAQVLRTVHLVGLGTALAGVTCMPISGFWAWLVISLRGLREARQTCP